MGARLLTSQGRRSGERGLLVPTSAKACLPRTLRRGVAQHRQRVGRVALASWVKRTMPGVRGYRAEYPAHTSPQRNLPVPKRPLIIARSDTQIHFYHRKTHGYRVPVRLGKHGPLTRAVIHMRITINQPLVTLPSKRHDDRAGPLSCLAAGLDHSPPRRDRSQGP